MKEIKTTVYITDDGKEFTSKKEAIIHEAQLLNVKNFVVWYCPDLTEGRGLQKKGIVKVHANGQHKKFVEHWCYETFGNKFDFCMGTYGSNAIIECWLVFDAKEEDISNYQVLNKIEENFVNKIWG